MPIFSLVDDVCKYQVLPEITYLYADALLMRPSLAIVVGAVISASAASSGLWSRQQFPSTCIALGIDSDCALVNVLQSLFKFLSC